MAKTTLNPVLKQINGQIGDLVFREVRGKIVISQKADFSHLEVSAAQQATRERFREAALYGKAVMANPALKAVYQAAAKAEKKPLFSMMVADYLHPPVVSTVDLNAYTGVTGEVIRVTAYDDVEVTAVQVSLADAGGVVLEAGAAVMENGRWLYTTTTIVSQGTAVTVTAQALDRPGNRGSAEATKLIA
ncbi:MAG: hypothetical protein WBO48_13580 [Candidatus Promineifilaceae bacterium]